MSHRNRFALSFFFAAAFMLLYGYQFNNGDQEEHLPYVYKLLQPELYAQDYIVPLQTETFTVRFFYAHVVSATSSMLGVPMAVFLLHFFCLGTVAWCIGSIAASRGFHPLSALFSVLVLLLIHRCTVGGNALLDIQLTCSNMAVALGSIGLLYADRDRTFRAYALIGMASLFQVLIGLHLFILVFFWRLYEERKQLRFFSHVAQPVLLYACFAGPMLFPLFIQQFYAVETVDSSLYHQLLFRYRNSHHYLPHCFSLKSWILMFFTWSLGLFFVMKNKRLSGARERVFLLVTTAGMIVYILGFGQMGLSSVGMTQWFKATIWCNWVLCIPMGCSVAAWFPIKPALFRKAPQTLLVASMLILSIIFFSSTIGIEKWSGRYKTGLHQPADLEKIHLWIASNTPKNALFVTFPADDSFLCESKRSLLTGYKAIIHRQDFMLSWYEKIKGVYGIALTKPDCKSVVELAEPEFTHRIPAIFSNYAALDYALIKGNYLTDSSLLYFAPCHSVGEFTLLKRKRK